MSFDSFNGDLWVGDVGWELWELIYRVERGANYGWSLVEGPQPVHRERTRGPTPIVEPTAAHSHIESRSITGGFVYRGDRLEELVGKYIYGDYVTGKMWALEHNGDEVASIAEIADTSLAVICYGVDNHNELYVVGYDGTINRLVETSDAGANEQFPTKLSETGLFASVGDHLVAPGILPYSINAEPWMDGAVAERFVAIPGHESLSLQEINNVQKGMIKGRWSFPKDGILMKTISLDQEVGKASSRRRLETQLLHFGGDTWRGYTYIWNDAQTDAELAPNKAIDRAFMITDPDAPNGKRQQTWHFASRTECLLCHTTRGGSIYGFTRSQLDRSHNYGKAIGNQLQTLQHIGLFKELEQDTAPKIVDPYDKEAETEARARAYLHINCGHCHRRGGGGTAAMDVQHHLSLEQTNLRQARPTQGTFGMHGAEVLGAGDPYRSVILYRMAKLGRGRMPYLGSSIVDEQGVRLIHDWVASLKHDGEEQSLARRSQYRAVTALSGENASPKLAAELIATTSGAMVALRAIADGKITDTTRDQLVVAALKHADMQIRDLFEKFLPEERRTKRLGTSIDPQEILELAGDSKRGRNLFLNTAHVQCKNCHQVRKQGKAIGPDLSEIGKKNSREQLLESMMFPSKRIDPKYAMQLVETTAGKVITGLLVKSGFKETILKDSQGKSIRIPRAEIEFSTLQQKSMMPELLLQDMTAQQVADLLAFLLDQR